MENYAAAPARTLNGSISYELSESQIEQSRLVELSYPGIKLARNVTFDDIWTLFLDSGFLYPEKIEKLQPVMPELQATVRALLNANGHLLATAVVRDEHRLEAQLSMLRSYEQTWMVHHLAALPLTSRDANASAQVTLALTYYGQLRSDIQWAKMFFRPNNPWPSRVFGGFFNLIKDKPTCDYRVFHYLTAPTNGPTPQLSNQVEVRSAKEEELSLVADWFTSRGRTVESMANDFEKSKLNLPKLSKDYTRAGLGRNRECIVAQRDGRITGFALVEVSSIGLNFSELTNAFTVRMTEEDPEARLALIVAAKQRYRELGRLQCVALEEEEDLSTFAAAGFTHGKDYGCGTYHRDHFADLEEYIVTLFSARRRRQA